MSIFLGILRYTMLLCATMVQAHTEGGPYSSWLHGFFIHWAAWIIFAVFVVFHGYAHGSEIPVGAAVTLSGGVMRVGGTS
ncbi:MAG: HupE/UreJ family protein [Nitrosomonas sp.]|nr:HupE/UreJ family protein [Nitrosomonas sp.]